MELFIRAHDITLDGENLYKVGPHNGNKIWNVKRSMDDYLMCSCRHFETNGILCSHAIKVLRDGMNCIEVPTHHIMKRWTTNARSIDVSDMHQYNINVNPNLEESERARHLCRVYTKISYRAAQFKDVYTYALQTGIRLHEEIEHMIQTHMDNRPIGIEEQSPSFQPLTNIEDASPIIQGNRLKPRQDPFRGKRRIKSAMEKALQRVKRSKYKKNMDRLDHVHSLSKSQCPEVISSYTHHLATNSLCAPLPSQTSQSYQVSTNVPQVVGNNFGHPMPLMTPYITQPFQSFQEQLQQNCGGTSILRTP